MHRAAAAPRAVMVEVDASLEVLEQKDRAERDGTLWVLEDRNRNGRIPFNVRDPRSGREVSAVVVLPTVRWRWRGNAQRDYQKKLTRPVKELLRGDWTLEVEAPRGASDAFLTPWHIDRGKLFVRHRCKSIPGLDVERITRAIELTRFPVPDETEQTENASEAGLVRAADLIGQLSDPNHDRKYVALFAEFQETGVARQLGYSSPADIAEEYPQFFWSRVEPVIGPALAHLDRTTEGKQWVAQLYAHVFVEEHQRDRSGPER